MLPLLQRDRQKGGSKSQGAHNKIVFSFSRILRSYFVLLIMRPNRGTHCLSSECLPFQISAVSPTRKICRDTGGRGCANDRAACSSHRNGCGCGNVSPTKTVPAVAAAHCQTSSRTTTTHSLIHHRDGALSNACQAKHLTVSSHHPSAPLFN